MKIHKRITMKILEEDIRKSLWPGLEDPQHEKMIENYSRKLGAFDVDQNSRDALMQKRIKDINIKINNKNRGREKSSHTVNASYTSRSLEDYHNIPDGCLQIVNAMKESLEGLMGTHQKYWSKVNQGNECSLSNKTIKDFNVLNTYLNSFHSFW